MSLFISPAQFFFRLKSCHVVNRVLNRDSIIIELRQIALPYEAIVDLLDVGILNTELVRPLDRILFTRQWETSIPYSYGP